MSMENTRKERFVGKARLWLAACSLALLLGGLSGVLFAGKTAEAIVVTEDDPQFDISISIFGSQPNLMDKPRIVYDDKNIDTIYVGYNDYIYVDTDIIDWFPFNGIYLVWYSVDGYWADESYTEWVETVTELDNNSNTSSVRQFADAGIGRSLRVEYVQEILFSPVGSFEGVIYRFDFKLDSSAPSFSMPSGNRVGNTFYINSPQTMSFLDSQAGMHDITILGATHFEEAGVSAYTFTKPILGSYIYRITATDNAGNQSTAVVVYDDKPATGKITDSGGQELGGYTNGPFKFTYSHAGDSPHKSSTLMYPNGNTVDYSSGTEIPANAGDGVYTFTVTDLSNNVLTKSVVLDTTAPTGTFIDARLLPDVGGDYYARIDSAFTWDMPGSGESPVSATLDGQPYARGAAITDEGRHTLVISDAVGYKNTYYLVVDKTAPTGKFVIANYLESAITSGYTNSSFRFKYSDTGGSGVYSATVTYSGQAPTEYASGDDILNSSGDGVYTFRVEDYAGNVFETSIVLDITLPTVEVRNTAQAPIGDYINTAFSLYAYDATSPFTCEIRKPGGAWAEHIAGTVIPADSGDGLYEFRATDAAGNRSTVSVTLDTVAPTAEVRNAAQNTLSGYTNAAFLLYARDTSPIEYYYINRPPGGSFEPYEYGTLIAANAGDGVYWFHVVDRAGNQAFVSVTLDTAAPTAEVRNAAQNTVSAYTNAAFQLYAYDATSPLTCEIRVPGSSWAAYTVGENFTGRVIPADSGDGLYEFRVADAAGNRSLVSVTLDTAAPSAALSPDAAITNKAITFSASDTNFSRVYYSSDGGNSFSFVLSRTYNVSAAAANNAVWSFYAEDLAGNVSAVKTVILDTIPADHGSLPDYTKESFTFSPADLNGLDEIYVRHGSSGVYTSIRIYVYTVAAVAENLGEWWFYTRDTAGNTSAPQRVTVNIIDTFGNLAPIREGYRVTSWYKVTLPARIFSTANQNAAGTYTFAEYPAALAFAVAKETAFRVGAVPEGWVYVSANNESVAQIYADRAALDAAILKYAKLYISDEQRFVNGKNNYYTPAENTVRQGLELPAYLQGYAGFPLLLCQTGYAFVKLSLPYTVPMGVSLQMIGDGARAVGGEAIPVPYGVPLKTALDAAGARLQGYYLVTESDEAGNVERYIIYVDFEAPYITGSATLGDGSQKTVIFNADYIADYAGTLYYCALELQALFDNIDDYLCVKISGRNLNAVYLAGEALPTLTNEAGYYGKYAIEVYDRSLNTLYFEAVIAGDPPRMATSALSSDYECRFVVTVPDNFNAITSLRFFKILFDGTYQEIFEDGAGTPVSFVTLNYVVYTGGKYTMRFTDLFGRAVEAAPVFFTKGLPNASLSGVSDGGVTNKNVSLAYSGDDTLEIYAWQNGVPVIFSDYTLVYQNNANRYTLTVAATDETSQEYFVLLYKTADRNLYIEYAFEIDCIIAELTILDADKKPVAMDGATNKAFTVTWSEPVTLSYYTSRTVGGSLGAARYSLGTVLSDNGIYYFTLKDSVGNTKSFTILLDDFVSYGLKGEYTLLSPYRYIAKNEITLTVLEAVTEFRVENADGYTIENGGTLMFDGVYIITVTDNYGNTAALHIEIDTAPPLIALSGVAPGGVTNGAVQAGISGFSKAYLVDSRNRIIRETADGAEFTEHGPYRVMAQDLAGNTAYADFTIDKIVEYVLSVDEGAFSSAPVSLVFSEALETVGASRGGEAILFSDKLSEKFTAPGVYSVTARDSAGNVVEIAFTILPERAQSLAFAVPAPWRPESAERGGGAIDLPFEGGRMMLGENGAYVLTFRNAETGKVCSVTVVIDSEAPTVTIAQEKNSVTVKEPSKENLSYALVKDGRPVAFRTSLSDPGHYVLTVADDLGNMNVYEFTINYRMNTSAVIIAAVGVGIGFGVLVLILRVRRGPKVR